MTGDSCPPHKGADIDPCCTCHIGSGNLNDYDHFKKTFSYEESKNIVNRLFD